MNTVTAPRTCAVQTQALSTLLTSDIYPPLISVTPVSSSLSTRLLICLSIISKRQWWENIKHKEAWADGH